MHSSNDQHHRERSTFAIPTEDKLRYKRMFDTLDTDDNGRVDLCEICGAMTQAYINRGLEVNIDVIYEMADKKRGDSLTFREFVMLMSNIEGDLQIKFMKFDTSMAVDIKDVQEFFREYHVNLSDKEAEKLIMTLTKDSMISIAWDEVTKLHIFQFFNTTEDVVVFWRQVATIENKDPGSWWKIMAAGGLAGIVSKTMTAPIERMRICYQVHGNIYGGMGLLGTLKSMIVEGGISSLWRSNGVNLVKLFPDSAIRFYSYEKIKELLKENPYSQLTVQQKFMAGSISGATSQFLIYPLEVLKVKYAISITSEYLSLFDCIQKTYRNEGIRSLYRGCFVSLVGIIPYAGIDLATYETLKLSYESRNPTKKYPGPLAILGFGFVSSMISQTFSYPISLLRSKLQAGVDDRSSYEICRSIYKNEGIRGFYRGLLPCLVKVVPAGGISYVVYEEVKLALSLV